MRVRLLLWFSFDDGLVKITKCFLTFYVSVCHITKTTKHDGHDDRLHLGNTNKS